MRWVIGWQKMDPAEAYAGWFTSVVESFLADEIGGKNVDGLRSGVLYGGAGITRSEQVLEPDRHIGCGGVEAGASCGFFGGCARAFVLVADK